MNGISKKSIVIKGAQHTEHDFYHATNYANSIKEEYNAAQRYIPDVYPEAEEDLEGLVGVLEDSVLRYRSL